MFSDPAPDFFHCSRRASVDWLASKESLDVVRELTGGRIAMKRLLSQALQADGFQVARNIRLQIRDRDWLGMHDLQDRFQNRLALERRAAGEQLVVDCS